MSAGGCGHNFPEVVTIMWCDRCGRALADGGHEGCTAARSLEPPRYCAQLPPPHEGAGPARRLAGDLRRTRRPAFRLNPAAASRWPHPPPTPAGAARSCSTPPPAPVPRTCPGLHHRAEPAGLPGHPGHPGPPHPGVGLQRGGQRRTRLGLADQGTAAWPRPRSARQAPWPRWSTRAGRRRRAARTRRRPTGRRTPGATGAARSPSRCTRSSGSVAASRSPTGAASPANHRRNRVQLRRGRLGPGRPGAVATQ